MAGTDWSSRRVLITGAGGVLGTALLAALARLQPAAVIAPARGQCDLLDQPATFAMMQDARPDVVFHLAARTAGVQGNLSFAGRAYYENALINLNVIEGARRANVGKIVAAGTTAVYSDQAPLPVREDSIGAGRPHGSEAAYAQAKLGMLAQLEAYQTEHALPFACLMLTNLYGPNDRFDEQYGHVVPSLVARFHRAVNQAAPTLTVWGDGSPTRDFLHAADAAEAFIRCADAAQGALNVATGQSVPIRGLVELLTEISGYRGEVIWDTAKPMGQRVRGYNIDRILATGWSPRRALRDGLVDTYRWYAEGGSDMHR